jgi:hypothetical protein
VLKLETVSWYKYKLTKENYRDIKTKFYVVHNARIFGDIRAYTWKGNVISLSGCFWNQEEVKHLLLDTHESVVPL